MRDERCNYLTRRSMSLVNRFPVNLSGSIIVNKFQYAFVQFFFINWCDMLNSDFITSTFGYFISVSHGPGHTVPICGH